MGGKQGVRDKTGAGEGSRAEGDHAVAGRLHPFQNVPPVLQPGAGLPV